MLPPSHQDKLRGPIAASHAPETHWHRLYIWGWKGCTRLISFSTSHHLHCYPTSVAVQTFKFNDMPPSKKKLACTSVTGLLNLSNIIVSKPKMDSDQDMSPSPKKRYKIFLCTMFNCLTGITSAINVLLLFSARMAKTPKRVSIPRLQFNHRRRSASNMSHLWQSRKLALCIFSCVYHLLSPETIPLHAIPFLASLALILCESVVAFCYHKPIFVIVMKTRTLLSLSLSCDLVLPWLELGNFVFCKNDCEDVL